MKNLLNSIWAPEEDDAIVGIQMVEHCIIASCGGPKPPREPDRSMNGPVCEV